MITAFASVETAISAMKSGAFDYITKPFKNDEVLVVLRNAVERRRLMAENTALRQNLQAQALQLLRHHRAQLADETGVQPDHPGGAEPLDDPRHRRERHRQGARSRARSTRNSPRAERAFVTVNSGNLPPDLLESTLFGHVKGAFTGAVYPKKGLCDMADRGTIFFDEIGNISPETQAKLLRVMQEREFMRLGGMETIKVDVRIVAATNCDLRQMMDDGPVSRGPLLPTPRDQRLPPPAPRAQGGHSAARPALPREVRRGERQARHGADGGGARSDDGVRLAGQRPRARERDGARRRARLGHADRRGPDSRARAGVALVPHPEVRACPRRASPSRT